MYTFLQKTYFKQKSAKVDERRKEARFHSYTHRRDARCVASLVQLVHRGLTIWCSLPYIYDIRYAAKEKKYAVGKVKKEPQNRLSLWLASALRPLHTHWLPESNTIPFFAKIISWTYTQKMELNKADGKCNRTREIIAAWKRRLLDDQPSRRLERRKEGTDRPPFPTTWSTMGKRNITSEQPSILTTSI